MLLTPKIQKAIDFAAAKHVRQTRKAGGLPYIVHPFSVAWLLAEHVGDEDVVVSGLLHDVLEDVKGSSLSEIEKEFGPRVSRIVKDVSEEKDPNLPSGANLPWEERKKRYLDHLRGARLEAVYVSAADKIHNLRSLKQQFEAEGNDLWKTFSAGRDKSLWFYEEVLKIVKERLSGHALAAFYEEIFNEFKKQTA